MPAAQLHATPLSASPERAATFSVHSPVSVHDTFIDPWSAAMRAGDWKTAWAINDRDLAARIADSTPKHQGPRHLQHIWQGEPLNDARVLVRCYHGLGDTIQFVRFVAPLRRIAREVTVWVQPELLRLVSGAAGVDRCLPLHDGTPDVEYDVDIEIMELPFALRAGLAEIGHKAPYLRGHYAGESNTRARGIYNIGLVWRAGDWDTRRSIDPGLFLPLARLQGIRLHLLQDLQPGAGPLGFAAARCATPDVDELAARLQKLDLVLTVDTMAAHLAGALGVTVWTMLCHTCDWRWGTDDRTVWYLTMRLFRQHRDGDWASVIRAVTRALSVV